ncbi:hypothetical protein ACTA71_009872 [Dictyostelium dimigraforme]
MKLIACLIFLTLSFFGFSKSTQISNQYVNFIAYSDSHCKTPSTKTGGFGYSVASDTCVTYDHVNNFLFTVSDGQVSWETFEFGFNIGQMCITANSPTLTYPINSCIPSNLVYLNMATGVTKQPFYYKVTTSSTPYLPINSYINSYMGEQCTENNIVVLEYFYNNTRITENDSSSTLLYFCDKETNYPNTQYCDNGLNGCQPIPNPSSPSCLIAQPFYNNTGSDSGSTSVTSSCMSGSCSATSGPATSGSYTGQGWSNPDDATEQKMKLSKNEKPLSVSSYENNNYNYIFCA